MKPAVCEPEHEQPVEDLRAPMLVSGERRILDPQDAEIAGRFLSGDRRGGIALCAQVLGRPLGRLCHVLLGSQAEAEEAAQETMIAAYHAAPAYRAEGTVRAWLFSIARRTCAQRLAMRSRRARRTLLLEVDEAAPASSDDPSHLLDVARREAELRAALDELPESDRALLVLRYEGEQPFREIAITLGIDEATARKRAGRALARLRSKVGNGQGGERP